MGSIYGQLLPVDTIYLTAVTYAIKTGEPRSVRTNYHSASRYSKTLLQPKHHGSGSQPVHQGANHQTSCQTQAFDGTITKVGDLIGKPPCGNRHFGSLQLCWIKTSAGTPLDCQGNRYENSYCFCSIAIMWCKPKLAPKP